MPRVRLGAVGYLNARPLVYQLDRSPRFDLRFDLPAKCADLLHAGAIDLGLIPSIEYNRAPTPYAIVPDLAIASDGPVASVAIFSRKPIHDVRSIALDTSSRTSVALVRVLCRRVFRIAPRLEHHGPDLGSMLADCDAALIIGDNALVLEGSASIEKIDLGDEWTRATGLPFVYAFWAGRPDAVTPADVAALRHARDLGVRHAEDVARDYFGAAVDRHAMGARYLRDNIKYALGGPEREGLELFYRYALEAGVIDAPASLRFFDADPNVSRRTAGR
jgi:chorismate dehydratase